MSLISVGYDIQARGLVEANRQIDALLNKLQRLSGMGVNPNINLGRSASRQVSSIDSVTKAMEKQRIMYDYMLNGATKSTASSLASFKLMGASIKDLNTQYAQLGRNKALEDQRKAAAALAREQENTRKSIQRTIDLTAATQNYKQQGFTQSNARTLATLQVGGATAQQMQEQRRALEQLQGGLRNYGEEADRTSRRQAGLNQQIMGIAKYAVLSAVIYGLMTATVGLSVATVRLADDYTAIQNRMKLYISNADTLAKVNKNLTAMSMENNVGLRESATLYARLAPSIQKLGGNAATITTIVDAFGKSMRIGGATAQEAAAATIQFSQAMASGKLQGDEFRSISEASPRFLKAIADGSGIATESLKKFSSEGLLTTALIARALIKEYPTLIDENKRLGVTLEQGINAIQTGFMSAIGELNAGAGLTEAVGNSLMSTAKSFATFAQTARQTGEEIKQKWNEWLPVISAIGDGVQILAIAIGSKYVASLLVAAASTRVATVALGLLGVGASSAATRFGLATTAIFGFGRAAQTAFTFLTGATGLLTLAIGGAITYYTMFRETASQANEKLLEQSKHLDLTIEKWKEYNSLKQGETVKLEVELELEQANANLDKSYEEFKRKLASTGGTGYLGNPEGILDTEQLRKAETVGKIYKDLNDEVISLDTAIVKISKVDGISNDQLRMLSSAKDEYNKLAATTTKAARSAEIAGVKSDVAGNSLQNLSPIIRTLTGDMNGLNAASLNAADALGDIASKYSSAAEKIARERRLRQQYGLDPVLAGSVGKDVDALVAQDPAVIKAREKSKKLVEAAAVAGEKDAKKREQLLAQNKVIDKQISKLEDEARAKLTPEVAAAAQVQQKEQDKTNAWEEAVKDQEKAAKKKNNIPEDVTQMQRQLALLKQTNDLEVSRIASAKEYFKWYGDNLTTAKQMAALQRQISDEEERINNIKHTEDSIKSALDEERNLREINKLTQENYDLEVARQVVAAKLGADKFGVAYANMLLENSYTNQALSLQEQDKYQRDILFFVKQGYSVEEAGIRLQQIKFGGKSEYLKQQIETVRLGMQELELSKANVKLQEDLTNKRLIIAALGRYENNQLASSMVSNQYLNETQVKRLLILDEMKTKIEDQNEALQKQQTLQYALERIDFSVFGDFGDPFEKALVSLNSMMYGVDAIKANYQELIKINEIQLSNTQKNLQSEIKYLSTLKEGTNEYISTEKRKNDLISESEGLKDAGVKLEQAQIRSLAKIQEKTILSGLSLTKSFFKEGTKGRKAMIALERTYQAGVVAFSLWEKKDEIANFALKMKNYALDSAAYISSTAMKVSAEQGLNVIKGIGAILTQGTSEPFTAFARMAAMAAVVAALGVAVGGAVSGSTGSYDGWQNEGKGTVFGAVESGSKSLSKSLEILKDNSDLMLPINSAMLQSLRNIENNIAGVANLAIRGGTGGLVNGIPQFSNEFTGIAKDIDKFVTSGLTTVSMAALSATKGVLALNATMATFGVAATVAGQVAAAALTGGLSLLIGFIAAPLLDKVMAGIMGKTTQEVTGTGLALNNQSLGSIVQEGANLQEYADIKTSKKSWFKKSTSYSTVYGQANKEISNQFTLIFADIYRSIASASMVLGKDLKQVENDLNSYIVNLGKIQLSGLSGEEIQEKLENVFGAESDKIAQAVVKGLDDFQQVGEGYYETVMRVAQGITTAEYYLEQFGYSIIKYEDIVNKQGDVAAELLRQSVILGDTSKKVSGGFHDLVNSFEGTADEMFNFINILRDLQDAVFATGKDSSYLTATMITAAGGANNLSNGLEAYFEMLSPQEQAAELTRRLTKDFDLLGQKLPDGVQGFRDLIKSVDITTESGQKLYGKLIALAPEFNDLQDSLESARSETNALVQSLRELAEQARLARGETESTRSLDSTRALFNQNSALALSGDQEAANRMVDLGKLLLTQSKSYSKSYEEYIADLTRIQRYSTQAADLFEGTTGSSTSTGTITNPPIIPPNSSANTNTSNTNNSNNNALTNQKIDELKNELITALYAIAKTNQNMSDRLERWDYGDSVSVHVEQDGNSNPVPVTIV